MWETLEADELELLH